MAAASAITFTNTVSANGTGGLAALTGDTETMSGAISGVGSVSVGYGQVAGTGAGTANATAQFGGGTVILSNTAEQLFRRNQDHWRALLVNTSIGTPLGTAAVNVSGGTLSGTGTITNAVNDNSGVIPWAQRLPSGLLPPHPSTSTAAPLPSTTAAGPQAALICLPSPALCMYRSSAASTINFYSSSANWICLGYHCRDLRHFQRMCAFWTRKRRASRRRRTASRTRRSPTW